MVEPLRHRVPLAFVKLLECYPRLSVGDEAGECCFYLSRRAISMAIS